MGAAWVPCAASGAAIRRPSPRLSGRESATYRCFLWSRARCMIGDLGCLAEERSG